VEDRRVIGCVAGDEEARAGNLQGERSKSGTPRRSRSMSNFSSASASTFGTRPVAASA
jgi:hypothetical protein